MSVSKAIKIAMIKKNIGLKELASQMGTTSQNLNNKFRRDNLNENDIFQMADTLGYDVKIILVDKETGEEI